MKVLNKNKIFGFTLIELLVVIGILAVLAVAVILVLKPVELIKQSRDSNRLSDLDIVNRAIGVFRVEKQSVSIGNANTVYVSLSDPALSGNQTSNCSGIVPSLPTLPAGWAYRCVSQENLRKTNGNGWIPIDFSSLAGGVPVPGLPVDPISSVVNGQYYTYVTDPANGSWKLTGLFESEKISKIMNNDGGPDTGLFEIGTGLNLANFAKGLTGYWKFDEAGGLSASDSSGNNRVGTLNGSASFIQNGKINGAVQLTATGNGYVATNLALNNFISGTEGTFSLWLLPISAAVSSTQGAYDLPPAVSDNGGYLGIVRGIIGGSDRIWIFNWDSNEDKIGVTYNINTWVHVTWVHSGGVLYAYKDGSLVGSIVSGNTDPQGLLDSMGIGGPLGPRYFTGAVDDVRVYNHALSAQEISAIYNATK